MLPQLGTSFIVHLHCRRCLPQYVAEQLVGVTAASSIGGRGVLWIQRLTDAQASASKW